MFEIILFHPEIPPNTGNLMRLSANTGARLHLVEPLGFSLDERRLRRAGLDYREWASVQVYPDLDAVLAALGPARVFALSGSGTRNYTEPEYERGDALLFGPESVGLPPDVLGRPEITAVLRIPMLPDRRSLNLANSVAIVVYEAWRQFGFPGAV